MKDLVENVVDERAPSRNRGWFQAGDVRINREGRPKGSKAALPAKSLLADRAPCADRLKVLFVPRRELENRLQRQNAPWIVNLPGDVQMVACRLDAERDSFAIVIRSREFPRIARGALVPDFNPEYNGLKWRRP